MGGCPMERTDFEPSMTHMTDHDATFGIKFLMCACYAGNRKKRHDPSSVMESVMFEPEERL